MALAQKIETLLKIIQNDKNMLRDIAKEYNTTYTLEVEGVPASFGKMEVSENGIKFDNTFEVLFEDLEDVFGENIDLTKINRYGTSVNGTVIGIVDGETEFSGHKEHLIHFADKNTSNNVLQSLKGNSIDEKKFATSITASLNKVVGKLSSRGDGEGGDNGNVDSSPQKEFTYTNSHHDNKDNHKGQNPPLPRRNFSGEVDRFMRRELPDIKEPEKDDDWDFEK